MADVFADAESIARRRALLAAMNGQAQQSPIVGDTGLGQALAKLGTAWITSRGQRKLDTAAGENRTAYAQQLGQEIQNYLSQRQGGEGPLPTSGPSAGMGPGEEVQANPRAAVAMAMASRFPELQRVGTADMAQLGKQELETFGEPKTELDPTSGKLVLYRYGNRGGRQLVQGGVPFETPQYVNGQLVDPSKPRADFRSQWADETLPNGSAVQRESGTGKLDMVDKAPKVSLSNIGNPIVKGQNAGMEQWAKDAGAAVKAMTDGARQSVKMLSSINQMEALHGAGVSGGVTGNAETFMMNLANVAGIPVNQSKLANNETFASEATKAWAAMMQANGGARGLVKEESDKIAQSIPSLLQSPQGQAQIMKVMRAKAEQDIAEAKKAQSEYANALTAQDPRMFTFGLSGAQLPNTTPQGAVPGGVGGQPPRILTLDEYLKQ